MAEITPCNLHNKESVLQTDLTFICMNSLNPNQTILRTKLFKYVFFSLETESFEIVFGRNFSLVHDRYGKVKTTCI